MEEFEKRITRIIKKYPYLVAECEGELVGYAYASNFHTREAYSWCVETSIYVKQDMRRMGIGRELYHKLENLLKEMNICNLNACIAYSDVEDEHLTKDSYEFHKRCGYEKVGEHHKCGYKFHTWYDIIWMEKIIGEHNSHQKPIIWMADK